MHNHIAYISGGKSHALLDAHNALQSIADKVDLFVHSGEGFCVLLALHTITFFVMLMLLKRSIDDATFLRDFNEKLFDKMQDSHVEYHTLKMFVDNLKKNGYVRNKHGVMQRVDDWMKNGSREPKRRRTEAQKIKDVGDHFLVEVEKLKDRNPHHPKEGKKVKHQLKPWMQVVNPTNEQRVEIHKACVDAGIEVESLDDLMEHEFVFAGGDDGIVVSTWISTEKDINIPFEEFIARIRGEWVKPKKAKAVNTSDTSKAIMDHFAKEDAEGVISVGEIEIDTTPKPLTRAEACLAILHEAKDAGFTWASSAIEQFDEEWANSDCDPSREGLQRAVDEFAYYEKTKEGWDYWLDIFHSEQVKSFQPKTQWPA